MERVGDLRIQRQDGVGVLAPITGGFLKLRGICRRWNWVAEPNGTDEEAVGISDGEDSVYEVMAICNTQPHIFARRDCLRAGWVYDDGKERREIGVD